MLKNGPGSVGAFDHVAAPIQTANSYFNAPQNSVDHSVNQARANLQQKAEESKIRNQLLFIFKSLKALHEHNESLRQDLAYAEYSLSTDNLNQASLYLQNILFNEQVDVDCRTIHNKILDEARSIPS